MRITRHRTESGQTPYDGVAFRRFALASPAVPWFDAPEDWSPEAVEMVASRAATGGIAAVLRPVPEDDVPCFLWRHEPDPDALQALPAGKRTWAEQDLRAVIDRIAGAWSYWGWKAGYFDSEADAQAFNDECRYLLSRRYAAPELGQWQRVGLHWAYGLDGSTAGCFLADYRTGFVRRASESAVAPTGAVINGVSGAADSETGVWALRRTEAKLSGLDCPAGVDASGVEPGDAAMVFGSPAQGRMGRRVTLSTRHESADTFAVRNVRAAMMEAVGRVGYSITRRHVHNIADAAAREGAAVRLAISAARQAALPDTLIDQITALTGTGYTDAVLAAVGSDVDPGDGTADALITILAMDDPAMRQAIDPGSRESALLDTAALSGWAAGAAGLQYATTAVAWNTCAADGAVCTTSGDGDFLFLDDTAAGRTVLNAARFLADDGTLDIGGLRHAARLMTIALDISIASATVPTPRMARRVWAYRPLALSTTGVGALLTSAGIAYDSDTGRNSAAALCALITGTAYAASAEMAQELGAFPRWKANRSAMRHVVRNHMRALAGEAADNDRADWPPIPLDGATCAFAGLVDAARAAWAEAEETAVASGYRNAHVTAIFPAVDETRLLDAGTRGIEPNTAIVCYERIAGGGFRRTVQREVLRGLRALGYDDAPCDAILGRAVGHGTIGHAPGVNHESLRRRGFTERAITRLEAALADATDIRQVFHPGVLGESFCRRMLGFTAEAFAEPGFDMLSALGFSSAAIEAANIYCCGAETMDGAPHLATEHRAVFDCIRPTGERSRRFVSPEAVVRMMAAVQPFISGAVGHHVMLPRAAPVTAFRDLLMLGWGLGLRTLTLHRDRIDGAASEIAAAGVPGRSIRLVAGGGAGMNPRKARHGGRIGAARVVLPKQTGEPAPMSQALALAHTVSGLSGSHAMKKSVDAHPERDAAGASSSRRESPDSPRSAASVSSSADVVVEQRQV